ncbi:MAG: TlpA disulfide reductase family protein [Bacteroidota bacterium]
MKKVLLIAVLFFSMHCTAQSKRDILSVSPKTVIKDIEGNKISYLQYIELTNSGDWIPVINKKDSGETHFVQLRKTTKAEKEKIISEHVIGHQSSLTGKKAPRFRMRDVTGKIISSATTKGKVVVLNFWFTNCKPCILEFPTLNKTFEKYKDNDQVVFAAITFEKKEAIESFLEKYYFSYPMITDAQEICDIFIQNSYPVNIVINKSGVYESYTIGGPPATGLDSVIDSALAKK